MGVFEFVFVSLVTPAQKAQCLNSMTLRVNSVGDKKLTLTIDTSNEGLAMVLKDYQETALYYDSPILPMATRRRRRK